MSFTVFSYSATVLLIQPNPTYGWTQPMSISEFYQEFRRLMHNGAVLTIWTGSVEQSARTTARQ